MTNSLVSSLLSFPAVSRVRRNHALEHATMQVMAQHRGTISVVGRSSFWGFAIYGDIGTNALLEAAQEALFRLRAGEHALAIHPNCGSNYVVAGTIAGIGTLVALGGLTKDRDERLLERLARLPLACAVGTIGVILSRPLGAAFQTHVATEADVGDLRIAGVTRNDRAGTTVHLVRTEG